MSLQKIAETQFTARVVREYSATPVSDDLGVRTNRATLYAGKDNYLVEWEAGDDGEGASIGIWVDHVGSKKVVDYDGVFELPKEIAGFLTAQGFDVSEVVV